MRVPESHAPSLEPAAQRLTETLISLESAFREAGEIAVAWQATIQAEKKLDTGNPMVDVVTAADREVQRRLLQALRDTPLESCRLLAEESVEGFEGRFDASSPFTLTLDPIDGTRRYTEKKPWFSTIIGLHDGSHPLYSFVAYPALGWWIRIIGTTATTSEKELPPLGTLPLPRTIVYTAGAPQDEIPGWVSQLGALGIDFRYGESVAPCGSKMLVLSGTAGGYYCARPNAYDGLFGLHYGLAHGRSIISWGAAGPLSGEPLDLRHVEEGRAGFCYPGGYLVLPPGVDAGFLLS